MLGYFTDDKADHNDEELGCLVVVQDQRNNRSKFSNSYSGKSPVERLHPLVKEYGPEKCDNFYHEKGIMK